jgi:hypothetical protein
VTGVRLLSVDAILGFTPTHHKELLFLVVAFYIVSEGAFIFLVILGKDVFAHVRESAAAGGAPMCIQLRFPEYSYEETSATVPCGCVITRY